MAVINLTALQEIRTQDLIASARSALRPEPERIRKYESQSSDVLLYIRYQHGILFFPVSSRV